MNVADPILNFGKTRRSVPALVEGSRTITYGELARLIRCTASHLCALGFQRGDKIGLCLKDTADHVIALLAVAHLGGVAVPLDWRARSTENGRLIDGLRLSCVLAEPDARLPDTCSAIPLDGGWHSAV